MIETETLFRPQPKEEIDLTFEHWDFDIVSDSDIQIFTTFPLFRSTYNGIELPISNLVSCIRNKLNK